MHYPQNTRTNSSKYVKTKKVLVALQVISSLMVFGDEIAGNDNELLDKYIAAQGYKAKIEFNEKNIKQFWINNDVVVKDKKIVILNNQDNHTERKVIKLKNVNEAQDCKIEIFSKDDNVVFSVFNKNEIMLSKSSLDRTFLDYKVYSATIHLEETKDFTLYIEFASESIKEYEINKIILSFTKNDKSTYSSSPERLVIDSKDLFVGGNGKINRSEFIEVEGTKSIIIVNRKILVANETIKSKMKIKNCSSTPINIYIGYALYNQKDSWISGMNFPYNNLNKVFRIVSSKENDDTLYVDSYPDWAPNCSIALNADESLSDIPNMNLLDGKIIKVEKIDDKRSSIKLNKPLVKPVSEGTHARINGLGGNYLYTDSGVLSPYEEKEFSSSITYNENHIEYTSKYLPRGTYYIKPIILSYSVDGNEKNTIRIMDYVIDY